MHQIYKIEGTEHVAGNRTFLSDPKYFPEFQERLNDFKKLVTKLVEEDKGASFVHFGDGDYFFLKKQAVGSAEPGKRALKIPYRKFDITPFRQGWEKADYHCVEYLEKTNRSMLNELYPNQKTIPTEYLYGLTSNKWFFRQFRGKIGLLGAGEKLDLIKELMKNKTYREYLCLEKFNDYIKIPQKFACDNIESTIQMVREQLEKSDPETKVFLYGVGHVKSGLIHHLPKIKNAVYLDIGAGLDGIAGLLDPDRPYAKGWVNHRLKDYNYSSLDLLNYDYRSDRNLKWL